MCLWVFTLDMSPGFSSMGGAEGGVSSLNSVPTPPHTSLNSVPTPPPHFTLYPCSQ